MKVAVLGVGLIGGSIGLAAKRRLGAEVVGFDPDSAVLRRAVELDVVDRAGGSVPEAAGEAEIVFCAAPVAALPELVAEALAATRDGTVVTDVGSTKRQLIEGLPSGRGAERFIGGHPLSGAETAGVENARADLFEGARWYLVPTERSSGVHYDKLQRAIADLGARPQAIDAEDHDRLMATVSHLPHVVANVLARHAAETLSAEADRLPDVGPSFRDTTRTAGANPPIWSDIFATNREALAGEVAALADGLREAAELLRAGNGDAVDGWHRAAGDDRRRLLQGDLVGGPPSELRITVRNKPGTVAEVALALGRAGVNIEDMALYPATDMQTGAISVWVAGGVEAQRAVEIVRGLGHAVSIVSGEE